MSASKLGKSLSTEHKLRIGIGGLGKRMSQASIEKMRMSKLFSGKGYSFHAQRGEYRVRIGGKHFGSFETEAEAIAKVKQIREMEVLSGI